MNAPILEDRPRVLSIYAQTAGVTSKMFRGFLASALGSVDLEEAGLPEEVCRANGFGTSGETLRAIHAPRSMEEVESARAQLAFEEAFWFFVRMAAVRRSKVEDPGISIPFDAEWFKQVVAGLPFELTAGQKRAVWDSLKDMEETRPMTRLLNGDVGSGKTAVAALVGASVAHAGYQSAILAPTELLAIQHAASLSKLLKGFGVKIGLYTAAHKDDISEADIIVGTHALLQQGVPLPRLAFVTVDEQHRFGVKQRQALREGRKKFPHLLSMTATPIPRTLALALYGDLSLSALTEKPKGRLPIRTQIIQERGRAAMYAMIGEELAAGRQAFVICSLIEQKKPAEGADESSVTVLSPEEIASDERKTVVAEVERLRAEYPSFGTIEMLHGKMKPAEKDAVMARMAAGEVALLVATSVVEVGVDIPNASVMVIEGADRFGLAQLHQFRGRVGRGAFQSYCFLCPSARGENIERRLRAVAETESGFELAQADLDQRGPGEMIGISQSGLPDFKMASLTDMDLLSRAKQAVEDYNVKHPEFLAKYSEKAFAREERGLE